jgi:hypothetical protein
MLRKEEEGLRAYLIDWGFHQSFFPSGAARHYGCFDIRVREKHVPLYDLGLLEWTFNFWLYSCRCRVYRPLLPTNDMRKLLISYAYKERSKSASVYSGMRGKEYGDAWQDYHDSHPLAMRTLNYQPQRRCLLQKRSEAPSSTQHIVKRQKPVPVANQ